MDELCNSTFWDLNLTWYSENPEFTQCFRQTALIWIPCSFLWVSLPLESYYLWKSKTRDIPYNIFNIIKLVLIIITSLTKLINIIVMVSKIFQPFIYFFSDMVEFMTLDLFFLLTWANIKRGIRSSDILFVFSILSIICGIPEIKIIIEDGFHLPIESEEDVRRAFYTLYYICMMIIFIINCFSDKKPQRSFRSNEKKCHPSEEASFPSKLFLIWFDPYVWYNRKQQVKDYLWELDPKDSSQRISIGEESKLKSKNDECESTKPSIMSILQRKVGYYFWFCAVLRIIFEVFTTGLFFIFDRLLSSLQTNEPIWKAYFYASLFFVNILIQSIIMTKYIQHSSRVEIRVRIAVISCLYKKALHISSAVRKKYSTSDIVNLMSVDTFQLQNAVKVVHYFISLTIQIAVSYFYLWYLLDNTIIISLLVVLGIFLIGCLLAIRMKQLQRDEVKYKDARCKFMYEILSGINVLKMHAWERSFENVAINLRQKENEILQKIAIINTMFQTLSSNSPFLSCLVAYVSYILITENVMDARVTLVSFVIFNYFRIAFYNVPQQLSFLQQVRISTKNMNEFLGSEEIDDLAISHDATPERLIMKDASFSWSSKDGIATLKNMNIKINDSSLVAIIGPVGAGKSSLISAFLGEMYKVSGYVNTRGKIAYVPQQFWILNATIKENITLGEDIDKEIYDRAIEACALKQDLKELTDGDLTEIGEKGINLSGGQKQRISLARVICQNFDIYFFDDPLSAVDAQVGNHIFQNVFGPNGVLKDKTRILVTHNTAFYPIMDQIIIMENGRISDTGPYQELIRNKGDFIDFLRGHIKVEKPAKLDEKNNTSEVGKPSSEFRRASQEVGKSSGVLRKISQGIRRSSQELRKLSREFRRSSVELLPIPEVVKKPTPKKLIKEERVKLKQIDTKLYWTYFKEAGLFLIFVSILLLISYQTILVFANEYLSKWVTSAESFETRHDFVMKFTLYGIGQVLCISISSYIFYKLNVKACTNFYHNLINCVLRWPITSFQSTPIGRIISRISDDMYTLDNFMAMKMFAFLAGFVRYSSLFIYFVINIPISCAIIIPVNIIYVILRKYYVGLSHQLKRIETIHKAPLYSHLVETVTGIHVIRAHGLQEKFTSRCYEKNDLFSASYQSSVICTRWFSSRIELFEGLTLCALTTLVLFERNSIAFDLIALYIAFTLQMVRGIAYMCEAFNEVEDGIIAVERISEYISFPQEPDWDKSEVRVPDVWPDKGEITFQDYRLRYRKSVDVVLKGISFTIKSGEKIGVIGRTGAGKTSLIQALFRILEPDSGTIFIDDVEITNVGLHTLRSRITVIPQDPILFCGTLRFNLDPFNEHQDSYLWTILEKAHLKNLVQGLPDGLNYMIDEGGQNLSFGQRQLICLARALLRRSKILVLDEATASVDVQTDELIQKTIRDEFSNCTIITIAHRLNTLQDYDKILVLDGGHVLNFDTTENLLKSSNFQSQLSQISQLSTESKR